MFHIQLTTKEIISLQQLLLDQHMNIETIRDYCLSKPNAEETLPFGPDVIVFKVNNKAFLLLPLDTEELRFNVKCDPDLAIELREQYSCVLPGWHMNKKHWNTIVVDGTVPSKLIKEWIDHSYELVNKKKK
jgi:predicted DNA-binding protein (MmcQ/YjbR family)